MTASRIALTALTTASFLGVAACGTDSEPSSSAETATSSATSAESPSSSDSGSSAPESAASSGDDERLSTVLAAIDAAVAQSGGTAYEIEESDDDGIWEIEVAKDVHSVMLEVKPNRDVTEHEESGLHPETREGLDRATIDLGQAVEAAMSEVDGTFDEADLTEIDGQHYWKVTIDTAATEKEDDDHQALVDVTDGTVSVDK